jgi:hypothetical protein
MNINLHIERLILDGLPVTSSQGSLVQAAVEAELMRLLTEQGLRRSSGGTVPHLPAGSIQVAEDSKPAQLGYRIAQAFYGSLVTAPASPNQTRSAAGALA